MNTELENLVNKLEKIYPELMETYHVSSIGIFGSYVRAEQDSQSDLDVLVSFSETPSLFRFMALENYLSEVLGIKVDLVMEKALKPRIGERIQAEVIRI